jgi:hypothetical protein
MREFNQDPLEELRRALGTTSMQSAVAEVMKCDQEMRRIFDEYQLNEQLAEAVGFSSTVAQMSQFSSRLDFISASIGMQAFNLQPGVAEAIAELHEGLSASRVSMIGLPELQLPALQSASEAMGQALEATSIKMTALAAVGVSRSYFEGTFAVARASLLGSGPIKLLA